MKVLDNPFINFLFVFHSFALEYRRFCIDDLLCKHYMFSQLFYY